MSMPPSDSQQPSELSPEDRFAADAVQRGLRVEVVSRPRANSLAEAAAQLGIEPAALVKTLVVKRHDGSALFALVPGDRQIAWAKLRAAVGVNKLSMPHHDFALEVTGYHRGTITPIGSLTALPLWVDQAVQGQQIALGAGRADHSAFVDADALIAAYDATVADISDPMPAR